MTTIDPATGTASGEGTSAPGGAGAPGFAPALDAATARLGLPVTLGEMVGLDPLPPAALQALETASAPLAAAERTLASTDASHPVIDAARAYLGVPYKWGGTDPASGLDCSGFVQIAFADIGVSLPRVSADQARAGEPVASLAEARPGDLVYWSGGGRRPNHIGIYLGDGKMLHAPRSGDVVKVDDVRTTAPTTIRRVA